MWTPHFHLNVVLNVYFLLPFLFLFLFPFWTIQFESQRAYKVDFCSGKREGSHSVPEQGSEPKQGKQEYQWTWDTLGVLEAWTGWQVHLLSVALQWQGTEPWVEVAKASPRWSIFKEFLGSLPGLLNELMHSKGHTKHTIGVHVENAITFIYIYFLI